MKEPFDGFVENIPQHIHTMTKTYISEHMAVFEPKSYVMDRPMQCEDYQFVIFYATPPPALINNKWYQLKKGSIIGLEIGDQLIVLPTTEIPPERYTTIIINKNFFRKVVSEVTGKKEVQFKRLSSPYSDRLLEFIENYKYEMKNFGNNYPSMLQSITTQIVIQLIRDINGDASEENKDFVNGNYIQQAIEYMHLYYSCNTTIKDICQIIHLSPNHFTRLFKQYTGFTPYNYLLVIRIKKAEEMLRLGKYSIGEIAEKCGFVNAGHFSSLFKRHLGVSPSEYKKNINP